MNRVYVLILNWNGWEDTIECLESALRLDHPDFRVLVCDNGSGDGSLERLKQWAEGRLDAFVPKENPLRPLAHPPVAKPVPFKEHDRERAEAGGDPEDSRVRVVFIRNGANLGFAGGNNVGLRYAMARDDFSHVWLLNNDTVVEPGALAHLARKMRERPDAGICGSTCLYYGEPGRVWARGGATYNRWLALPRCIGLGRPAEEAFDPLRVERRMDYVAGASMFVSREFLREVGLMSEEFFLFFEDLEWSVRGRDRYALAYSPGSVVYHKVGASTSPSAGKRETAPSVHAMNRKSKILYTRRHVPWALPTVLLAALALEVARSFRGK